MIILRCLTFQYEIPTDTSSKILSTLLLIQPSSGPTILIVVSAFRSVVRTVVTNSSTVIGVITIITNNSTVIANNLPNGSQNDFKIIQKEDKILQMAPRTRTLQGARKIPVHETEARDCKSTPRRTQQHTLRGPF